MVHCCVLGCKSRSERKECNITFHSFPKHPHVRKSWIFSTGRPNWEPKRYDRICSKHFAENCFQKTFLKVYVNALSVPTLNVHETSSHSKTKHESTSYETAEMLTNEMEREIGDDRNKSQKKEEINGEISQKSYCSEENIACNIKQECRACLSELKSDCNAYFLFQKWDSNVQVSEFTLADDMSRICNVHISISDGYSQVICSLCYKALSEACGFVALVRRNDSALRQRPVSLSADCNGAGETMWPKPIDVNKSVNDIIISNTMEVEVKKEVLSDDEYNDGVSGNDVGFKPVDEIKVEPEDYIEESTPMFSSMNGTSLNKDSPLIENGYSSAFENVKYLHSAVKAEPVSDEEGNETPPSDLPLQCILCARDFVSVSGLKAHVIAQHSYKTVKRKAEDELSSDDDKKKKTDRYICAICKRCFTTCTDLMVHETCHNKHTCYLCGGRFDSFALLAAHRVLCSAPTPLSPRPTNSPFRSNETPLQTEKILSDAAAPGLEAYNESEKGEEQRDNLPEENEQNRVKENPSSPNL